MAYQHLTRLCVTVLMSLIQPSNWAPPSAQEVLTRVAEKYHAPQRYLLRATITIQSPKVLGGQTSVPITIAIERPSKMRMEGNLGALALEGFNISLWVIDGETGWLYDGASNQYYKFSRSSSEGTAGRSEASGLDISSPEQVVAYVDHYVFVRYRSDLKTAGVAALAGMQKLSIEGGSEVECYVVQIDSGAFDEKKAGASRNTWWVDKDSYIVWKEDKVVWLPNGAREFTSTMYNVVSIDEPMPKDLFVFVPPTGSTLGQLPAR